MILKKPAKFARKSFYSNLVLRDVVRRPPRKTKLTIRSLCVLTAVFLGACGHFQTKKFTGITAGTWEGKALIRDKANDKRGIVNLKIKAIDGSKLRMDLVSPVGTHLGSVLLVGDQMEYLNVAEKTYTKTKASAEAVGNVLRVPIDPQALYSIIFEKPIWNKRWSCSSDEKGFLKFCKDLRSKIEVEWSNREGEKRNINLQHATGSIQLNLYKFSEGVSDSEKAFQLNVPKTFKRTTNQ